ncbi:hypothetical protein GCM10007291_50050 [Gemmobacter nanjingensis]|jgi:uncharacterized membrane protein|uniref:DUF2189 domain-containing protein n=1 Tax=Gemmobacter nanjingensis TaxID=488454 RepID=A0ABQ3FV81_9RHOB|nr:DUF2189 domain-containing protein [Gemmobacter nanjingensis]GHC42179.1 hypothetical protein GCM10007291_50050 [Gemmobacter nanjingensis]
MLEPLPTLQTRAPVESPHARHLPARAALDWLAAGWRDLARAPGSSLAYGAAVVALSWAVLWGLAAWGLLYLALPALSGFLIVGPFLAVGLYQKSHRLAQDAPTPPLRLPAGAAGQIAMAGLLLGLLVLFWLRAADLLYALFFGIQPFPGAAEALQNAFTTPRGWALIATGLLVGGLFAAFAFAVSVFSFPMLVSTRRDALTAMGRSFALTAQNLRPMLGWGAIVTAGITLSILTGLAALVLVFPLLGHGTWHAWRAIDREAP